MGINAARRFDFQAKRNMSSTSEPEAIVSWARVNLLGARDRDSLTCNRFVAVNSILVKEKT